MRNFPLVLLAIGLGLAHGQSLTWSKVIGNEGLQALKAVRTDAEGNIILFGQFNSYPMDSGPARQPFGGIDAFLHKMDPSGRTMWFRNLGSGSNGDKAIDMDMDSAGNIHVLADMSSFIGSRGRYLSGENDTVRTDPDGDRGYNFAKYGPDGKVLWIRQFRSPDVAELSQIRVCNGTVAIAGLSRGKVKLLGSPDSLMPTRTGVRGFLAELDGDGRILSTADVDGAGNVYIGGRIERGHPLPDLALRAKPAHPDRHAFPLEPLRHRVHPGRQAHGLRGQRQGEAVPAAALHREG